MDESVTELEIRPDLHEQAMRHRDIWVSAMVEYVPDVAIRALPALMARWDKGAEDVWVDGKIQVWSPDILVDEDKNAVRISEVRDNPDWRQVFKVDGKSYGWQPVESAVWYDRPAPARVHAVSENVYDLFN